VADVPSANIAAGQAQAVIAYCGGISATVDGPPGLAVLAACAGALGEPPDAACCGRRSVSSTVRR